MAYTRGNLAVKERPAERTYPDYREKTKVVTRRTYIPIKEKLLYLMTVAVCVMVASMLIWQNANIYDLNKQNQGLDKDIKKSKQEISQLEVKKQELLVGIRDRALQMGYVEPSTQTIHVPRSGVSGDQRTESVQTPNQ